MNMLIDRAKNAGALNEVLEASDNRQAHWQRSHFTCFVCFTFVTYHRGYNVLHHAAEHLLAHVIRHLLSSQPQLQNPRFLNSRTTPLGKADRYCLRLLRFCVV